GCGNGNVKAGGTVKFSSGEAMPAGTVFFETEKNRYMGEIKDGTFELGGIRPGDGLPAGIYQVSVQELDMVENPLIAERFRSAATSGISFEVRKGSKKNFFEIVVEKP
ncbi:MAG: hypothetical protein LBH00_11840, partial [Planctomycetaceae bacterium]|nr:hypothetical protein [Planctomycetaceae bacterium]